MNTMKVCNCCQKFHLEIPQDHVITDDGIFANCECGSTMIYLSDSAKKEIEEGKDNE